MPDVLSDTSWLKTGGVPVHQRRRLPFLLLFLLRCLAVKKTRIIWCFPTICCNARTTSSVLTISPKGLRKIRDHTVGEIKKGAQSYAGHGSWFVFEAVAFHVSQAAAVSPPASKKRSPSISESIPTQTNHPLCSQKTLGHGLVPVLSDRRPQEVKGSNSANTRRVADLT